MTTAADRPSVTDNARAEAIKAKALELHDEYCTEDCKLGATAPWLGWAEEALEGEAAGRAETATKNMPCSLVVAGDDSDTDLLRRAAASERAAERHWPADPLVQAADTIDRLRRQHQGQAEHITALRTEVDRLRAETTTATTEDAEEATERATDVVMALYANQPTIAEAGPQPASTAVGKNTSASSAPCVLRQVTTSE